jgi:hypothetical protein
MPEFMGFGEGGHYVRDFGLPRTCWFALSTKAVDDFSVIDTLAGGIGEVSGTGYARQSQPAPNWSPPWPGETVIAEFEPVVFTTHTARDWPDAVRSIVLVTTEDDSGVAIAAWDLREGGKSRDMSEAYTTDTSVPFLQVPRSAAQARGEAA